MPKYLSPETQAFILKYKRPVVEFLQFFKITKLNWFRFLKLCRKKGPIQITNKPSKLSDFRVACILDEFSFDSFRPEAQFRQIRPSNWQQIVAELKPHFILIESAWNGEGNSWNRKVSKISNELIELLEWANTNKVPTVFWHKEVPPHFKTFMRVTKMFDYIFLTDADCIPKYKRSVGHHRVYFLPFACQPKIHHPIEEGTRKDAIIYAGSFYPEYKYPDRYKNFIDLYDGLRAFEQIDIYDRNVGKDLYPFPPRFENDIKGSLPFVEMCKAYRSYEYGLNMNSVKNSSTMCSRRIFELIASNTFVVGNYAKAVKNFFGDTTLCSDSKSEIVEKFKVLHDNPDIRLKTKLAALRKVMQEHTYQSRFLSILNKIATQDIFNDRRVLVVAFVKDESDRSCVQKSFDRQLCKNKRLEFVNTADDIIKKLKDESHVALFSPKHYYGAQYIVDMMLAFQYFEGDVVTKCTRLGFSENSVQIENDGWEYRRVKDFDMDVSVIKMPSALKYIKEIQSDMQVQGNALSIDKYNFCRNFIGQQDRERIIEQIEDIATINAGMVLKDMEMLS